MAMYISFFGGDGSDLTPFMPRAGYWADAEGLEWQARDCRQDRSAQAGHAFVWVAGTLTTGSGYLYLGEDPSSVVTDSARTAIADRYGINIPAGTTVRQLVAYYVNRLGARF